MNKKYVLEDVGIQKHVIRNFRKFEMTKDKDASSRILNYYLLINDLANDDIKFLKPFMVEYLL